MKSWTIFQNLPRKSIPNTINDSPEEAPLKTNVLSKNHPPIFLNSREKQLSRKLICDKKKVTGNVKQILFYFIAVILNFGIQRDHGPWFRSMVHHGTSITSSYKILVESWLKYD